MAKTKKMNTDNADSVEGVDTKADTVNDSSLNIEEDEPPFDEQEVDDDAWCDIIRELTRYYGIVCDRKSHKHKLSSSSLSSSPYIHFDYN